jgi:hypothetical protein
LQIALIRRAIAADRKLQKKAKKWGKEHGFKNALKATGLILALGPFWMVAALFLLENPYQQMRYRIMRHEQRRDAASAKTSGPARPAQARRPAPARATLAA